MPYSAISLNRIAENGRGKQLLRVSFWRDSRADMHALRRLRTNVEDSLCYSKGHARYSSTGKNTGHSCAAQQSSIWDQALNRFAIGALVAGVALNSDLFRFL